MALRREGSLLEEVTRRRPYNAVSDFVDANVARGLADKVAFADGERTLSYGGLQAATFRFAGALKSLGMRPEERLILINHDTVDFPVVFWGAMRAGIVVVPLNTLLTAPQYAYMLADSRARAVVLAAPLLETIGPALECAPHLRHVIVIGAEAKPVPAVAAVHRFEDLLAQNEPAAFTA